MNSDPKKKINALIAENNRSLFILSVILSIITASFEVAIAFILMALIDNAKNGMDSIIKIIAITLVAAVAYVVISIEAPLPVIILESFIQWHTEG